MTNAFPALPLWREGWFVKRDAGSGLLESVLTHLMQVKASHPSDLISSLLFTGTESSTTVLMQKAHFSLHFETPPFLLPFLGCHGGIRCQEMLGETERDSSPPPHSGCECEANFISPATPLSK